jgi:hypothetical protein
MLGIFEFFILIILLFILVVYAIYSDIKSDVKDYLKTDDKKDCKKKCTKPTKVEGNCYHPIKYNAYLKTNQEVKSELICPWSCSSGYSDDPRVCQYDQDCSGCTPTSSFNSIDEACPTSTYGCCADKKTEKTDEFGNNCLGKTGPKESFTNYSQMEDQEKDNQSKVLQIKPPHQMYPACPNISCPNENAFNKDSHSVINKKEPNLETLPPYPWSVVSEYRL